MNNTQQASDPTVHKAENPIGQSSLFSSPADSAKESKAPKGLKWQKAAIIGLGLLLAVGAAAYLSSGASLEDTSARLTHVIARGDLTVSVTEVGNLESAKNHEIKCRVKGETTVIWIIEAGAIVKAGDVLVRLDAAAIEDKINEQKIKYQTALSTYAQSETDVATASVNIQEYLEGTYRTDKQTLLKDIEVAKADLLKAQDVAAFARKLVRKGYISELQLKSDESGAERKKIELELLDTKMDALERFTKVKKVKELEGILKAKEAKLASDKASLDLEKARLDREEMQLGLCTIVAETSGMVIFPKVESWREQPAVERGAKVREDQILLMIPDLTSMQLKVGAHEAIVSRIKAGMKSNVTLQEMVLSGEVQSVASVASQSGWWNGNQIKYDTIIKLGDAKGLKPGMSGSAEVIIAQYQDELLIPVAAVLELEGQFYCWVKTSEGYRRRRLDLAGSDDKFIVVTGGVSEGDEVVLNPRSFVDDAKQDSLRPLKSTEENKSTSPTTAPASQTKEPSKDGGETAKTTGEEPQVKDAGKDESQKNPEKSEAAKGQPEDSKEIKTETSDNPPPQAGN